MGGSHGGEESGDAQPAQPAPGHPVLRELVRQPVERAVFAHPTLAVEEREAVHAPQPSLGDVPVEGSGGGLGDAGAADRLAGGQGDEPPAHGPRLGPQPQNLRQHQRRRLVIALPPSSSARALFSVSVCEIRCRLLGRAHVVPWVFS